jgi:hypothetical protein
MTIGIDAVLNIGGKVIDRLWPDPAERDKAKLRLVELQQKGELADLNADLERSLAQIRVNEKQAESGSIFVSGARPFIMWVCGFALAYATIIQPVLAFVIVLTMDAPPELPAVDTSLLYPVLMGLLGLGTMRTVEKKQGVARSAL